MRVDSRGAWDEGTAAEEDDEARSASSAGAALAMRIHPYIRAPNFLLLSLFTFNYNVLLVAILGVRLAR